MMMRKTIIKISNFSLKNKMNENLIEEDLENLRNKFLEHICSLDFL